MSSSGNGFTSTSDDEEAAVVLLTSAVGTLVTTGGVLTTVGLDARPAGVQNRREIEIGLARGRGSWINEIAAELGLPPGLVPRLGDVLRRHRDQLTEVLRGDELRAHDWSRVVSDAICCDPWLYPFARERYLCKPAGEGVIACQP